METTYPCNINEIEASVSVWFHCAANGQPTSMAIDREDLVEWASTYGEVERYYCPCGELLLDWPDVMDHLAAPTLMASVAR